MRILKYLMLLLLLFAIGAMVFVATQKSAFAIRQTRVVKAGRASAFVYVNDYRNWPAWFSAAERPHFPSVTTGRGGGFSWDGALGSGSLRTTFAKENDSLYQDAQWNGFPGHISWKFRDKKQGLTEITVTATGKFGFGRKISTALSGGPQREIEALFESSLDKLDNSLIKEITDYKIEVAGEVIKTGNFHLKQSITSTIAEMPRNQRIMRANLAYFFTKNGLKIYGKPFVLYDFYDPARKLARFSFCMPVRQQVFTMSGSDISSGKLEPFRAVKVTLTGDYSHLPEAYAKAGAFIREHHLHKTGTTALEWYRIGKEDGKTPSQWVTDVYIPVGAAPVVAKPRPSPTPPAPQPEKQPDTEEIPIP